MILPILPFLQFKALRNLVELVSSKLQFVANQIWQQKNGLLDVIYRAAFRESNYSLAELTEGCRWFFCFKELTGISKYKHQRGILFLMDACSIKLPLAYQSQILKSFENYSATEKLFVGYPTYRCFLHNVLTTKEKTERRLTPNENCQAPNIKYLTLYDKRDSKLLVHSEGLPALKTWLIKFLDKPRTCHGDQIHQKSPNLIHVIFNKLRNLVSFFNLCNEFIEILQLLLGKFFGLS